MPLFIERPWVALVVGAAFALLWSRRRTRPALVAGCAWSAYCAYEYLMYARVLCTGECNIRVDLLMLYPLLLVLSGWALIRR